MAKVFLELSTGMGPLIRCLPIALWLRRQGHEVRFFSRDHSGKYLQDFGFEPIDIVPDRVVYDDVFAPEWRDLDLFWGSFGFGRLDWLRDRIEIWIAALRRYRPDVVVSDIGPLSAIAARILELPFVAISQSCFHPLVPAGTPNFWRPAHLRSHRTRDVVNALLEQRGSRRTIRHFSELCCGDVTILPSIPEFDRLDVGPSYNEVFTGPILWDGLRASAGQDQWPSFPSDRPVVFAYTGRMHDSAGDSGEVLLRALLESARTELFNLVIVTGGAGDLPGNLDLSSSNVRLSEWIPIAVAYSRSALVVHHGGHGSCLAALSYAVPSLIVPTHNERAFNADVMRELGAATVLSRRTIDGEGIVRAVGHVLQDRTQGALLSAYSRRIKAHCTNPIEAAGRAVLSLVA